MRVPKHPSRILTLLMIPACLIATPILAQRFGGFGPDERGHEERAEMMFELLDLSPGQADQLKQIHAEVREQTADARQQMKDVHATLRELMDAPDLDEAAIRRAAALLGAAQTELFVTRARMHQELRQILSPEQMEKLETLKQMGQRRHGFHGRGLGKRPRGVADDTQIDES